MNNWRAWRAGSQMGYIHLAFSVIVAALNDLATGDAYDQLSALTFFFSEDSTYPLMLKILEADHEGSALSGMLLDYRMGNYSGFAKKLDGINTLYRSMRGFNSEL